MKAFYITMAAFALLLIGAVIGAYGYKTLTDHINQEVASKLDDVKVLQQAGYMGDQYIDGLEPAKWGN
jgi:hypothetical protein